jgi:hypothetical protein
MKRCVIGSFSTAMALLASARADMQTLGYTFSDAGRDKGSNGSRRIPPVPTRTDGQLVLALLAVLKSRTVASVLRPTISGGKFVRSFERGDG